MRVKNRFIWLQWNTVRYKTLGLTWIRRWHMLTIGLYNREFVIIFTYFNRDGR